MMLAQCIAMLLVTGLTISFFYAIWRKRFMALIGNADTISKNVLNSSLGKERYFSKMYQEDSQLLSMLNNVMYICTTLCPLVYCCSVPLSGYIMGTPVTRLPVPVSCEFELHTNGLYGVFTFFQFVGLATPAFQKLGNEFIMFSLFKIQSAHFKYLSESMEEIDKSIKRGSAIDYHNKLIIWIKMHQEAIRNIHSMKEVFSPIIVLYYLSMIVIVASGFFYQLNAEGANFLQGFTVGIYMVITIVQFYLLCHLAEELAAEGERISVAAYRMCWHRLGRRTSWFVPMIMNISQKPVGMTAYGVPRLVVSREAFLTFMVNLVSAYMGFSKIKEI